jgi:protein MAK11
VCLARYVEGIGSRRGVLLTIQQDCKPKAKIIPTPRTKIHQIRYVPDVESDIVSVSTEDGRVLFYNAHDLPPIPSTNGHVPNGKTAHSEDSSLPNCSLIGQLGGPALGTSNRIKDYIFLSPSSIVEGDESKSFFLVTVGSDGSLRIWALEKEELVVEEHELDKEKKDIRQLGRLLGTYETGNRITCLQAFVMTGEAESGEEADEENNDMSEADSDDSE